jgi:hypothetical protein
MCGNSTEPSGNIDIAGTRLGNHPGQSRDPAVRSTAGAAASPTLGR